jgi:hypothetical protein
MDFEEVLGARHREHGLDALLDSAELQAPEAPLAWR